MFYKILKNFFLKKNVTKRLQNQQQLLEQKKIETIGLLVDETYFSNKASLVEVPVKTTPANVREANEALFRAKMTLPAAAKHCGMTQKEMKLTFFEYLKYNKPDYCND